MSMFTMHCPWCGWFGMSSGVGDDSPADFLKADFVKHVQEDHEGYLDVAEQMEPVYCEKKTG